MRTRFAAIALLLACAAPLHADAGATTVVTRNGKSYQNCRVLKVSPDGVTFRHSNGIAKVLFVDMNEAAQEQFGYDPAKTRAYEAKVKEDREKAREAAAKAAADRAKALAEARQRWLETQTLLSIQQSAQMQAIAAQNGVAGGGFWFVDQFGWNEGGMGHGFGYGYGDHCDPRYNKPNYFTHPGTASIVGTYARRNGVYVPCVTTPAHRSGWYVRPSGNVSLPAHYGALVRPVVPAATGVYGRSTVSVNGAPCVSPPVIRSTTVARTYHPRH